MPTDTADVRAELRAVVRDLLGAAGAGAGPGAGTGTPTGTRIDWRRIADCGWLGLEVPDALDGAGATFAEVAVVVEEFGRAAAGTPFLGPVVLGIGTLGLVRAGPVRDGLLREAVSGATVLAAALVDGADDGLAGEVPFRVERFRGRTLLHGQAGFVPGAADGDRLLALALDAAGTPVVVPLDPGAAGLEITAQPVLDTTRRFGLVRAEAVAVDEESVLRFDGDPMAAVRRLLDRAAVAVACDSLGLAEAMLAATVAHARSRQQFGRPIGSFQAVKHACADMLVQVSVSRQLVSQAVRRIAEDHLEAGPEAGVAERVAAGVAASMAKSYACAAAVDVVGKAMQLHGGMGYTWDSGIHVYLKRAALNRSLFGSPAAHRRRLARRYR
jgi:alkylation response protein AidB-like acyl-CoA dehydrogenase